jgi:hypothetical protein
MRSVDLASYADTLAAEAATLAARLERARGRLRQAALEQEARRALPAEVVARIERLGLLASSSRPADDAAELLEVQESLSALERLQAWVERELAATAQREPTPAAAQPPRRELAGRHGSVARRDVSAAGAGAFTDSEVAA